MREISVALLHVEQEQISKDEKIAIIENEAIGYPGDSFLWMIRNMLLHHCGFGILKKRVNFYTLYLDLKTVKMPHLIIYTKSAMILLMEKRMFTSSIV